MLTWCLKLISFRGCICHAAVLRSILSSWVWFKILRVNHCPFNGEVLAPPPPPPRAGGGSRIFLLPTILFHPLSYPVVNSYRNLYCHLPSQMNRHSCLMCFTWGSISNWLCDVVPTFPLWTLPSVSCCIRQSLKWRQIVDNRGIREGSSSPPVGHFSIY